MYDYRDVEVLFKSLCKRNHLPVPLVSPALPTDPCDFTSPTEVRININVPSSHGAAHHARHLFGHYICGLHEYEPHGIQKWADPIAEIIADWIKKLED